LGGRPMHRDIIVIGGSAGALDPLRQIARSLPADLPAAVFVVLHLAATQKSTLASILNREAGLPTVIPREGDPVRPGYLYVPTPDHHLEISDGHVRVGRGPRINGSRPAVDVLFRSAAAFGGRVIGVVLSGALDDGSAGLAAIRAAGGVGIVQSPDDAVLESMPSNAIMVAEPEHVLPAAEIGSTIVRLIGDAVERSGAASKPGGLEMERIGLRDAPGEVTGVTCPDCHGSIWLQRGRGGEVSFACRIGHSYSPESFFEIQRENVENALWAGVRSLEEQASFAEAMAARAAKKEDESSRLRYAKRVEAASENAEILRKLILGTSDE